MYVRAFLIIVSAHLLAAAAAAQATIRVLDADSIPIPYALVSVAKSPSRAADGFGLVRFSNKLAESIDVEVQRIGYRPFKGVVRRSTPGGEFVIVLQTLPRGIDTVRTIAARETPVSRTGFYDRMDRVRNGAITGEFITPEELDSRNPIKITDVLMGRRSVQIKQHPGDSRRRRVALGRGGLCGMTILLDGQRMNGTLEQSNVGGGTSLSQLHAPGESKIELDQRMGIDDLAATREIMAIEIYPSTANAPAELIPLTGGGSCGIIALWTGPRR